MITRFSAEQIRAHQPALIGLLRDAVDGGSSVSFVAPLETQIAAGFWDKVAAQVERGERIVLIAEQAGEIAGCVHLVIDMPPNGQHRGDVQKMLVHSRFRRRGLGRALLAAVEDEARKLGRTLLVLDTERDSNGEALYTACGWTRMGVIPQFAKNYDGTKLVDTVYFYRLLQE
jgi:GNAT superfamily N-acetyltransferase